MVQTFNHKEPTSFETLATLVSQFTVLGDVPNWDSVQTQSPSSIGLWSDQMSKFSWYGPKVRIQSPDPEFQNMPSRMHNTARKPSTWHAYFILQMTDSPQNVFPFLFMIGSGLILSNSLYEYTYNLCRICGVYILLMSCISEKMGFINQFRFLIEIYENALTPGSTRRGTDVVFMLFGHVDITWGIST